MSSSALLVPLFLRWARLLRFAGAWRLNASASLGSDLCAVCRIVWQRWASARPATRSSFAYWDTYVKIAIMVIVPSGRSNRKTTDLDPAGDHLCGIAVAIVTL